MNTYLKYQEGLVKSLLAQPDKVVDVVEYIEEADFQDVNYRMVYKAILELYLEKEPIALPGVALKISESGGAIDMNWVLGLDENISIWVQAATPVTWAKLLKRESMKNQAREILGEGINEIKDQKSNPLSVMDEVSTKLTETAVKATSLDNYSIQDAVERFKEESKILAETGGATASINSAYPSIDYYTGGWGETHLITVGARTGVGKTVFAINNAVAAMAQGKSVMLFSLEMTEREIMTRMVSSISMVPIQTVEKALPMTEDEQKEVNEALEFIANSKLTIDTTPLVTVEDIKRKSFRQAQKEEGLDMIIIDYLQLISNEDSRKSRQEAVAEVSRNMKILAKELNVPVMVLVQLNRERRDDEDTTPRMSDIRESGAIANDSNVIILIDRKTYQEEKTIDPKATFIIAKNRQGEADRYITVRTRLEAALFIDDNVKGQEFIDRVEASVEAEGAIEEVNYASEDYKEGFSAFENLEIDDDAFGDLFAEEEGDIFGGDGY